MNKARELQNLVKKKNFASMGNSGRTGQPYQESYFADLDGVAHRRGGSRERLEAIRANLPLQDALVLDVGCNIGFFCFGLAENGARTVGIDYDRDSIDVAEATRQLHGVERATFLQASFDRATAERIRDEHGVPDVILLNSVVHWLMYANDSLRRVVDTFRPLLSDSKVQYLVYEPSSTGVAYYPELLSDRGVAEFMRALGMLESRCIGEFPGVDVKQDRRYFLGKRDVPRALSVLQEAVASPERVPPEFETLFGKVEGVVTKANKIRWWTESCFIKSAPPGRAASVAILQSEARALARFESAHAPSVILAGPVADSFALVCGREPGQDLGQGWVAEHDVPLIEKQLGQALSDLKRAGLAHNDLRPENLLWDSEKKHLSVLDFEFCTPLSELAGEAADESVRTFLLGLLQGAEAASYVDERLRHLGGRWRSSFGLGTVANDRYAAKKVLFSIKNRRSYLKGRLIRAVSGALPKGVRGALRTLGVRGPKESSP